MRALSLPVFLVLVASTASAEPPVPPKGPVPSKGEEGPLQVFLLDVEPAGVDQSLAVQATAWVAETIHALGTRYRVLTRGDVGAVLDLEASKKLMGCEEDSACLAKLAEGIDADLLLSGTIGKVGTEVMLSLSLVDVEASAVRDRVSGPLGPTSGHPTRVAELVRQLFGVGASDNPGARFSLPAGDDLSFAVFDLTAAGVSEHVATNLTQVLSAEIKRVEGATVIGKDDVAAMIELEADKAALGCSESAECLAEVGGALGVSRIVVGHVGRIADNYVVSLRLISTKQATVENRVTETFRGLEAQTLQAVRHAARRLLGIADKSPSTLAVTSPHEGAEVWLDGELVGSFPLRPIEGLAAGRHELRVRLSHHKDLRTDVYLGPGETVSLWAELERVPDEWYESWVFWTVAGGATAATLAVVAGGIVVGYQVWDDNRAFPLEVKASLPVRGATP